MWRKEFDRFSWLAIMLSIPFLSMVINLCGPKSLTSHLTAICAITIPLVIAMTSRTKKPVELVELADLTE